MAKRSREDAEPDAGPAAKRNKISTEDRLSRLSDELILRVLSYLPVSQLVACERLSHKYQALAADRQLWKQLYYHRFVRPRANRLLGVKTSADSRQRQHVASTASRWLGEEQLLDRGVETNWKRQYRLRNNWTKGTCAVDEIQIAEQSTVPPILVQMRKGVIYMADIADGLRAWSAKGERRMVAKTAFEPPQSSSPPTSLAVDAELHGQPRLIVGFEDGSFSLYTLDLEQSRFSHTHSHAASTNGVVSSTALSWPYAATMTATQLLSLYRFSVTNDHRENDVQAAPRLMHSLRSQTVWPPLAISLKVSGTRIVISVAYALPTYLAGWTVGLQEVEVSSSGDLLSSRLSTAIEQHYRPLEFASPPLVRHLPTTSSNSFADSTPLELRHIHSKPTSLSYTHPYLLVSHPDNTLTLYLVTSTKEFLTVSPGSRLWGHTSSVSGAQVGDRGKAVSVSRRGDELRVWELEGGFGSAISRKRLSAEDLSVRIRPEKARVRVEQSSQDAVRSINKALAARRSGTRCGAEPTELTLTRGWIGFDDESVVVLKEHSHGRQALVVYDFT